MNFSDEAPRVQLQKDGFDFNLDGHTKRGGFSVRAARDPVAIPTDPVIVEIAKKALCHLGLGTNCFTLTNVYGIEVEIPYNSSVEQWQAAADKLLKGAMDAT